MFNVFAETIIHTVTRLKSIGPVMRSREYDDRNVLVGTKNKLKINGKQKRVPRAIHF